LSNPGSSRDNILLLYDDLVNVSTDLLVEGDIHCTGKLTSDGGNDPPYVLFNQETQQSIHERIELEIPKDELNKYDGQVLYYDGDKNNMFIVNPATGEQREFIWKKDYDKLADELAELKQILCAYHPDEIICT